MKIRHFHNSLFACLLIFLFSLSAVGKTLFVDPKISVPITHRYDPAGRNAQTGSQIACKTIQIAADQAQPGDTVFLRSGTYHESLKPAQSGTHDQRIMYSPYKNENITLTGADLEPAIDISNRSYLTISGFTVTNVKRWVYAVNTHHCLLENNRFSDSLDEHHSSKSGIFFQQATFNQILNNRLDNAAEDSLTFVKSDRNLIAGNKFTRAHHALWAIRCGNFNILRKNYFENPNQKIGEAYDCDRAGFDHNINRQKSTRYNLIEDNIFAGTKYSPHSWYYNAIQYGGQNGIIRRNIFYNNQGGALSLSVYPAESLYNLDNRIYHNLFYRNHHGGVLIGKGGPNNLSANIFKNNIFFENTGENKTSPQITLHGMILQGFCFENNCVMNKNPNDKTINHLGRFDSLSWWQENNPDLFRHNISQSPLFVNVEKLDFRPAPASPVIDAGKFLTQTRSAGAGRLLPVHDASYFCDGFSIPGQPGDQIQLEQSTQTARILKINYADNTIFLDVPLRWKKGQGVHLPYQTRRPDIGAFEFTSSKK